VRGLPTLSASKVIWTLISPLTGSFSNGVNLGTRRLDLVPGIQGDNNILVPVIDSVIVLEGRFHLNGSEEGMGVFRAVVDVAYQVRIFRSHVAK
jgi:hypothetical protein